ncbi:MAG: cytochrome P450 [Alphaproteobacteria bacterium]|nr:cytochrome P450 [Alphaproteobacteria bacterium]MBN9568068.1 cytochrome P450 [Alphaproteobacteria bacterium]OJU57519.1 MAG: cytochrome [Alphaproteobacteria bacterium 62-8]
MKIPHDIAETIVDPKAYAAETPVQEAFTRLRREMPLAVAEPEGVDPFWVVTKHSDILAVEKQNELFHNGDRATVLTNRATDQKVRQMMGGSPHIVRSLVQMDNPDHGNYRRLTQPYFLPQNVRKLEPRIREIAKSFVDRMADKGGQCDFARDVTLFYPLHVIMEILGVPEVDEPFMLRLTQELFGPADPDVNRMRRDTVSEDEGLKAIMATVADFTAYFNKMTHDRRANPQDDVASAIANGTINGQPLGEWEAMSYYIIVATAGHDTTSNTTAGALWALAEAPEEYAKLQADIPNLMPGFIEESIRWVTPVKHFMRTAMADTTVRDQAIKKDDWLFLAYPSGNRDEDVFDDPFRFRVDRTPNKQLAFGYGAHVCIGQHLARMEMRIFWEELLPRLKEFELAGEPKRTEATFVCGPKSVPIRYKMN